MPFLHDTGMLIRDTLTDTYSRALFQYRLPDEIERARRYEVPLSIFLIDVDYFKTVNDAYGHGRGDQILKDLVQRVRLAIRGSDVLFRYGGDEFILLLPNTTKNQAADLACRILDAVRALPFSGIPPLHLTVSIGVATYPDDGKDPETLFHTADLRSYDAKRQGRNRFVNEDAPLVARLAESPRLIERDDLLGHFDQFLSQAETLLHGLFIITGISGTGRTRFLQEVSSRAVLQNLFLFPVPASRVPESVPQNPVWSMLVDILCADPFSFKNLEAFLNGSSKKGLFLTVDNITDLNHTFIPIIRRLLSPENPLITLVAYTTTPGALRLLVRQNPPLLEAVQLSPLSLEGARILLRNCLHWEPPEPFIQWIHQETGGLPKDILLALDRLLRQRILHPEAGGGWNLESNYAANDLRTWLSKPPAIPSHNLPAMVSDFLGREKDLESVSRLLDAHRLVTLTGPGGIGKTRLALQVANLRLSDYSHGVFFIPLSNISDPNLLIPTIAQTLGIVETSDQSLWESLKQFLREKNLLLILDNYEQIIPASKIISELLQSAPRLFLLVTSRQPLHLSGEQLYSVPPLEVPENPTSIALDDLTHFSAVALFLSRAQAVRMDFALTEGNREAIADLCQRLEGLPLAIELAAARIHQYTPQEMLAQSSLALLSRGPVDFPSRHQAIRSVVEWSVDLLSPNDRLFFPCLSVFRDGFSAFEAKEICACLKKPGLDIQEGLDSLTEKNLLRVGMDRRGQNRFYMLEPVQEFALEQLNAGELKMVIPRRHMEYFLSLAEKTHPSRADLGQKEWLDDLEEEDDNLRASLDWALTEDREIAARLAKAMGPFWEIRNHWSEARLCLEAILNHPPEPSMSIVGIYLLAGRFARLRGEYARAEEFLQIGIKICNESDCPSLLPPLLQELTWVVFYRKEFQVCKEYLKQAQEISQSTGDTVEIARILSNLGWVEYFTSELPDAARHLRESLEIFERAGQKNEMAQTLNHLARVEFTRGNYRLAEESANRSLELSSELGDLVGIGHSLRRLAEISRAGGKYYQAELFFHQSLNIFQDSQNPVGLIDTLLGLAELYRSQQKYDQAIQYYSRHLDLVRSYGMKVPQACCLKDMGEIARYQGNLDQAEKYYQEALTISSEIGTIGETYWIYRAIAEVAIKKGDGIRAREYFHKSLALHIDEESKLLVVIIMSGLIGLAILEEKFRKGAIILGAVEALYSEHRSIIAMDDVKDYEARINDIRNHLTLAEQDAAMAKGRSMAFADALAYALDEKE